MFRYYRPKDYSQIEAFVNSNSTTNGGLVGLLQLDNVDSCFNSENVDLLNYFDGNKIAQLIDFSLVADTKKGPAFSKDSSKRAFISTKILSSGKDLIIDYFFQSDCNYGKTKKPETAGTDSGSENEYRRSRDVAVFVTKGSTVESTQIIDGEEVKFTEYLTRLEDTVGLDKLFAFLARDSKDVNNTAFGNFSKIVKSFIDLDDIKIDFMKYFYASKINPHNLINSVEWSAATDLLDSIVNLQKGMDNNSNNLQFIFHRLKLYIALQDKLFSSTVLEEVENLSGIFKTLLKTSSRIWDAAYFIEKVLTERTRFELLVNAYANAKDTYIRNELMALITTIILYLNEKFEEDGDMDNRSSNNEPFSQFNAMETTDLQIPIVISKNDEHLTSFCGHLNSVLPKIFSFIPKSSKNCKSRASPSGVDRVIVGLEVIGLFKFVSACLLFKRDSIFQIIIENKVLESLQDIFLRSEGNNLVQNEYMNIVTFILQQQESPIYTYIFQSPLLTTLLSHYVEKKQGLNGSKASYLIQIAKMGQSMVGQKRVSSLGGFFGGESWRAFETQYLPDIKSKESYLLGGYNPKIEKEEDAVSTGFDFNHARVMERMNNAFVSTRTEKDAFQDDPWNNFHEMIDPDNNDHLDTSDVVISLDFVTDEVDPEFNDTNFYAVTLQIDIDGLLNEINN